MTASAPAAIAQRARVKGSNMAGCPRCTRRRGGVRGRRACLEEASAQEETEKQFPDEQEKEGSEDSGGNIQQDSRLIADHK